MAHYLKKLARLVLFAAIFTLGAAPLTWGADYSEGRFTFATKFSDKFIYNNFDFMLPLFESRENAAFFINPRLGVDFRIKSSTRDAERFSIGLGQRLFLPGSQFGNSLGSSFEKGIIAGWSAHFDAQYSLYDNFMTKVGVGGEVLSEWVDVRVNGYVRLTGDKKTDSRGKSRYHYYGTGLYRHSDGKLGEILLSGVDGEVGGKLPVIDQLGEMRIFGGLYYYNSPHVRHVRGVSTRFEWKPIPFVSLNVGWTSSDRLNGANWFGGLGFHLPFSMNALSAGGSPMNADFTPRTGNLWHDRYTEPIRRNDF